MKTFLSPLLLVGILLVGCTDHLYWKQESNGTRLYQTRSGDKLSVDFDGVIRLNGVIKGTAVSEKGFKEETLKFNYQSASMVAYYTKIDGSTFVHHIITGDLYDSSGKLIAKPVGPPPEGWLFRMANGDHLWLKPDLSTNTAIMRRLANVFDMKPGEDWNLKEYDVVSTGKCQEWKSYSPESCWNWLWKAPLVAIAAPVAIVTYPFWGLGSSGSHHVRTYPSTEETDYGILQRGYLGPVTPNAYGPGTNSDATGRPFIWQPQGPGPKTFDPFLNVKPNAYGPGVGMDQYGRPVQPACPPGWAGPC